ncbi:MAG: hypothetical protein ACKOOG_12675 [Actinomycetota bacterium]
MRRLLVVSAALTVVLAACGGNGDGGSTAATTTTAAPAAPTTRPPTKPVARNGPSALILRAVPSGYVLQPEARTDTGPVDFDKAVRDDVAANGEVALRNAGFVDGYQRTWTSVGGLDRNTVLLYRFRTPPGASGYADHWLATLEAAGGGVTPRVFEPPLIPGGIGVTATYAGTTTAVVIVTRGGYAIQAVVEGAAGSNQENAAAALAGAQLARLPA